MFDITQFKGEIPKVHRRLLPPGFAQFSANAKLDRGVLTPYRSPTRNESVPPSSKSIFYHDDEWLNWTTDVDAVLGPVALDRLYYTGNGIPKLRVDGVNYPLTITAPGDAPKSICKINNEYLTINEKEILLRDARAATLANGAKVDVSVDYNTATIVVSKADGLTTSQAQGVINGLLYRNSNSPGYIVPSLKIIRITRIRDNGGQSYDSERNRVGSDTRLLEDIGTTVKVAGTTLEYAFPAPLEQDETDVSGQNDRPTLSVTGLSPTYGAGSSAVLLFKNCTINTVEPVQRILELRISVENLTNGIINPKTSETLVYSFTYLSKFDEESAPAPLSRAIDWSPGQGVRISDISISDQTTRIDRKRIYRSQTSSSGVTSLYFVGEIPNSAIIFNDNPDINLAGEAISTLDFDPPPDRMMGLVSMPNGMMAAFDGRTLMFSEPWKPHAWPTKYHLVTDFTIVGLATAGSTLVILTNGCPYVAQGTHPENVTMDRIEVNYPCVSKRSIVDLGYAVAYASTKGIVSVDQSGARLITGELFTSDQWDDMQPATFVCSQHEGRYILSHDDKSPTEGRNCAIIDLTGASPFLIRTSWKPLAFHFMLGSGRLYFSDLTGGIYEFDPMNGDYEFLRWKSAPFVLPFAVNLGAILVEGDKISKKSRMSCKVYADGRLVNTVSVVNSIERLNSGFRAKMWEVEIVGTYQVYGIHLARTVPELVERAQV